MKQKPTRLILFSASFIIMLLADYLLGETAEFFNLYYFVRSLFSNNEIRYSTFQGELGNLALPAVLTGLILFHSITSNIIYHIIKKQRRYHEKG